MTEEAKVWQASIWIGPYEDEPVTLFGESLSNLRDSVAKWLIENQPERFGNASPSYEITRRYNYSHASSNNPVQFYDHSEKITEGWVGVDGSDKNWSIYHLFNEIEGAALHFVNQSMIPYKGPDWQEIPDNAGTFPLHKIRTVKQVEDKLELNDHLQRGWYLLSLEFVGSSSYDGLLEDRKTLFIIGHPEENADHLPAPASESHQRMIY